MRIGGTALVSDLAVGQLRHIAPPTVPQGRKEGNE